MYLYLYTVMYLKNMPISLHCVATHIWKQFLFVSAKQFRSAPPAPLNLLNSRSQSHLARALAGTPLQESFLRVKLAYPHWWKSWQNSFKKMLHILHGHFNTITSTWVWDDASESVASGASWAGSTSKINLESWSWMNFHCLRKIMYKDAVISEKHRINLSRSESECSMELKQGNHAQTLEGREKSGAPPLPLRYPNPSLMTSPSISCNFSSEP